MSESHWGEESLKWSALAVVGTVAFMAAMIGLWFWAPWEKPTEIEWLVAYETWADGIDATYAAGGGLRSSLCESSYDEEVGSPPTERLEPVSVAALRGCATLSSASWHRRCRRRLQILRTRPWRSSPLLSAPYSLPV